MKPLADRQAFFGHFPGCGVVVVNDFQRAQKRAAIIACRVIFAGAVLPAARNTFQNAKMAHSNSSGIELFRLLRSDGHDSLPGLFLQRFGLLLPQTGRLVKAGWLR